MSMLTLVPMGLGLGPRVRLEVEVVPELTALMDVLEAAETFPGSMVTAQTASAIDNRIKILVTVNFDFLIFIFLLPF